MEMLDQVEKLIHEGTEVLSTTYDSSTLTLSLPDFVDTGAFTKWKTKSLMFFENNFSPSSSLCSMFKNKVTHSRPEDVERGIGVLKAVKEGIESGTIGAPSESSTPLAKIQNICDRFHLVAEQLKKRHDNRKTIDMNDEYDVQDLFHALLRLYFEDIRKEETTQSYASKSSRADFLLKHERIIVELKTTLKGLEARKVSDQLIIDINRYKEHSDCDTMVCFVYDPDGRIENPRGFESDLNKKSDELNVEVWIRPL